MVEESEYEVINFEPVDERDYAADVAPAFSSYDTVVVMRAIAEKDRTEENYDADVLRRNEDHLKFKMAIPAFVAELSAEQKKKIEDLSL